MGGGGWAGEFGVWGHPACGPRVSPWVVRCVGRHGVDGRARFASVVLSHLLAGPLAELDGGELVGPLLVFDADGEFLFSTVQGVADGAGAPDCNGVGLFDAELQGPGGGGYGRDGGRGEAIEIGQFTFG